MAKVISKETFEEYKHQVIRYLQDVITDVQELSFDDYEKIYENDTIDDIEIAVNDLGSLRDYFSGETWIVDLAMYDMIDESDEIRASLVVDRAEREVMAEEELESE